MLTSGLSAFRSNNVTFTVPHTLVRLAIAYAELGQFAGTLSKAEHTTIRRSRFTTPPSIVRWRRDSDKIMESQRCPFVLMPGAASTRRFR